MTDVILELNHAEVVSSTFTTETYGHLVEIFSSTFDLGRAFVTREDLLDALEKVKDHSGQVAKAVKHMHEDMATLQRQTADTVREINDQLKDVLAVNREETYRKVAEAIRQTQLPVPFESAQDAEDYIGASQMHRDAISLAFSNSESGLAAKETIEKQLKKRFPAGLLLDYLFTPEAKASLRLRQLGPSVRSFLAERARWLMGDGWKIKSEESIMFKVSQHLHYADSRLLRRSKRLQKAAKKA